MPVSTILETRYLLRDKLDALLRKEFGCDFNVKVSMLQMMLSMADELLQVAGDRVEVTAPRKLTQARLSRLPFIAVRC